MQSRFLTLLITLLLTGISANARAQEWRDFQGQFTFVSKIPERKELKVSEKEKFAAGLPADHKFLDESLLINEKNRGIANILIWAIPDSDKPVAKMPIHPSYEKDQPTEHVIKIKDFVYAPRVSAMRTGAKLKIEGEDPVEHYSKIDSPALEESGRSIPEGHVETFNFKKQTRFPASISCTIHPHEKAYLLVRDNPYFAVTNDQGVFEMKNLPVGEWRFKAWHEKSGYITEVTIGKLKHNWPKGEFKVKLDKFDSFLGAIELSEKLFDK
jgi:hypothetical protein